VVRHETREIQEYDLVVAKNGPKFKEAAPPGSPHGPSTLEKNGCPASPIKGGMTFVNGIGVLHMPEVGMEFLALQVSTLLAKPVRDATGLTGKYDIALCWAPENLRAALPDAGPSLQQALQDQLGLRMESKKGPVEFLVVEHAEKSPAAN